MKTKHKSVEKFIQRNKLKKPSKLPKKISFLKLFKEEESFYIQTNRNKKKEQNTYIDTKARKLRIHGTNKDCLNWN